MTRRSYPDLHVLSPGGKLSLEALSPDNGNDLVRDGTRVKGTTLGSFQKNFRYRLAETGNQTPLWERWQSDDEGSPVSALVADSGHVVIRAHSMDWVSDELLFIDPRGVKRLAVVVTTEG
jgi:hypothetical protein